MTGPVTARLYLRLLAAISLIAWLSIGVQLRLLIGHDGLLPIAPLLAEASRQHISFFAFPTLFWIDASDSALIAAVAVAAGASLYGVLRPGRIWLAFSLPLYISVSLAAQDFCGFQWDLLLVEAMFLACFLDPVRPSRAAMWMPKLLLVKLYFESGLSKALSPAGDWISGVAMVPYFETSPLPTSLARYFHALPGGLLQLLSWGTLFLELVVPLFIFGPRILRRCAFVFLGVFQIINVLTSNYGFFVPLAGLLHLWLLDDETLVLLRVARPHAPTAPSRRASIVAVAVLSLWCIASVGEARLAFGGEPPEGTLSASVLSTFSRVSELWEPLRIVAVYHLFASVTTERIEPIIEVRESESGAWRELALYDKPGPLDRRPPFVAPHQPRVDFQLWFHGLNARGRVPGYLVHLQQLLCDAPDRVATLFTSPPSHVVAVRVRYARYHMTPPGETNPWTREDLFARPELVCGVEREENARR